MTRKITAAQADYIIQEYARGIGTPTLAQACGVRPQAVNELLRRRGVAVRNPRDAKRASWAHMTEAQRAAMLAPAWAGARARGVTSSDRVRMASARQACVRRDWPRERAMLEALEGQGLAMQRQIAIGPYNVDLAHEIGRLAVEVQHGEPGRSSSFRRDRIEQILGAGWDVLIAYCTQQSEFDYLRVAQAVIAYTQGPGADPAARGRYGMIGRDGSPGAGPQGYLDHLPRIPGF